MRPSNKSRSRNKNRRNNNNNSGGNILNRVYDSAGPDGRVRGTPQQVIEKYQALTHDSSLAGDRVAMENFQQHAEHYVRLINEAQRQIAERREAMESQIQERAANQQKRKQNSNGANPDAALDDPGQAPQPDAEPSPALAKEQSVLDVEPGGEAPELVETPESAPKKKRQNGRSPRRKPKSDSNVVDTAEEQPAAAPGPEISD